MVFQMGFTDARATNTWPLRFHTLPHTQGLSDRGSTKTGFNNNVFMFFLYIIMRSPLGEHRRRRQTGEAADETPLRRAVNGQPAGSCESMRTQVAPLVGTTPSHPSFLCSKVPSSRSPFYLRSAGPVGKVSSFFLGCIAQQMFCF